MTPISPLRAVEDTDADAYRTPPHNLEAEQALLGAILVWSAGQAGDFGPTVQMAGYVALGGGWALMLAAIFLRTRYHRRRMAELDGGAQ